MAVLETAAHIDDGDLPPNRFVVRIDLPDAVWAAREELLVAALPTGWAAIPAGGASVRIGGDWLRSLRSAILLAPSVIVPEERVALINPAHPDARRMVANVVRSFEYSRLFRPAQRQVGFIRCELRRARTAAELLRHAR